MAKKKKNEKRKKVSSAAQSSRPTIDPDVIKSVWSIFAVALAVLSILSFLDMAGTFGEFGKVFFESAFGWGMYLVPLLLLSVAGALIVSWGRDNNKVIFLAALLLFVTMLGFLAMFSSHDTARGGYLGYLFIWPFMRFLGSAGTLLALITFFIVSLLLAFNLSFRKFLAGMREDKKNREGDLEIEKNSSEATVGGKSELKVKTLGQESKIKENDTTKSNGEKSSQSAEKEPKKKKGDSFDFAPGLIAAAATSFKPIPLKLLEVETDKPTSGDIVANANIIQRTFQNFGIDVEMSEVSVGPTVTQYTLKPAEGVKLARILALHNDLSLALAAHPIRIEAPIPGRSLVGIEIPNKANSWVRLRHLIGDTAFSEAPGLTIALGRDVAGVPVYANLAKMPHMLIAGSTGSGKTIALTTIILSLLYKMPPQYLRLILVDPKRVEFAVFADIPHLLAPVITDNSKAINALKWAVNEMDRRFDVLAAAKARDIESYNSNKKIVEEEGPLPYIVIIIDELADLMASKGKEVEALIIRVAQMARAVGIHLVLATQRPSVEVITGLIKANITARIAFQVASQVDSRTILDMAGAEKLLGNGDMLFLSPERSKPRRVQGAFVRDIEVKKVVEYLRGQRDKMKEETPALKNFDTPPQGLLNHSGAIDFDAMDSGGGDEELYEAAKDIVIKSQKASASLLQRRLRIGYARAARMLDLLEESNVIGPGEGAKPREVYLNADDLAADDFVQESEEEIANREDEKD